MSVYGSDEGLYGSGPVETPAAASVAIAPVASSSDSGSAQVSATDAIGQALEVLASPAALLSEVLPANPGDSKLPYGLAVFGACVVAIIWANSIDKGRK
jgi:hypothetical protein